MALELKLDRDKMHTQFSSWRLQPFAGVTRYKIPTTGHASGVESTALDFLHTRASVLRNHLLLSEGRLFVFTQTEAKPGYYIYELLPDPGSDEGVLACQVAELASDAGEQPVGGAVEAVVDCSLAVVAPHPAQQPQQATAAHEADGAAGFSPSAAAAAAAAADGSTPGATEPSSAAATASGASASGDDWQLLLSRGHGDVVLLRRRGKRLQYSNAVHPIRPRLPYTGVRPVILEAAAAHPNGDITAVAWAMRGKGHHTAACCEVFAITLRPSCEEPGTGDAGAAAAADTEAEAASVSAGAGGGLQLQTVGVRLLLRTKLPPHLVRILQPSRADPHGEGSTAGHAGSSAGPVVLLGFDPNTMGLAGEDDEEDDGVAGGSHRPGSGPGPAAMDVDAAQAPAGGGDGGGDDDDGDDMDPRTLEQAAARLAHMTSAERAGPQPPAQWADIYKESGPDGVGAMGAEPVIDLAAWRLGEAASGGGGGGSGSEKALAPFWRLSCGAHRLLSAEGPLRATPRPTRPQPQEAQEAQEPQGAQEAQEAQPILLGVTDDVDCAVVCVEGPGQQQQQRRPGAQAGAQRQEGEAGSSPGREDAAPAGAQELQARHALSIPALAYVAAGKTYKRHLLLASSGTGTGADPGSGTTSGSGAAAELAAVLVESQRFMYLYGTTSVRQEYGRQQVVELGLEGGETVLGARLMELPPPPPPVALAVAPAPEVEGGGGRRAQGQAQGLRGGGPIVVVATQRRLLSYRLRI